MAILMLIGMPAFEKIAKGQGAELAAREMVGKLKAVRAYAATNRQYTALLLPQNSHVAKPNTSHISADYMNRSYRACIVNNVNSSAGTADFVRWIEGESWKFMPSGVIIAESDSDKYIDDGGSNGGPRNNTILEVNAVNFSDIDGNASANSVAAIIFAPSGKLIGTNSLYVNLAEGAYSGGNLVVTNRAALGAANVNSVVSVKVDSITGRVSYYDPIND